MKLKLNLRDSRCYERRLGISVDVVKTLLVVAKVCADVSLPCPQYYTSLDFTLLNAPFTNHHHVLESAH